MPAANRLAEAAAKESQTLQRADDDSAAGESAKSSNLKNTSRADRKSPVDRQQKSRQAEQLRVRDKYRELQRLRIAARAATGSNPSSSDSATSAASGQSD